GFNQRTAQTLAEMIAIGHGYALHAGVFYVLDETRHFRMQRCLAGPMQTDHRAAVALAVFDYFGEDIERHFLQEALVASRRLRTHDALIVASAGDFQGELA